MVRDTGLALAAIAKQLFDASFQSFVDSYPPSGGGGASTEATLEAKRFVYGQLLRKQMPDFSAKLEALKLYSTSTATNPLSDIDGFRQALMELSLVAPSGSGGGAAAQLDAVIRAPSNLITAIITEQRDRLVTDQGRRDFLWSKLAFWGVWSPNDAGLPAALDRFTAAIARFEQARQQSLTPPTNNTNDNDDSATEQQEAQSNEDRMAFDFPTREVADAIERQDALLAHLNLFKDYYRYVLLRGLPPAEQLSRLVTGLPPGQSSRLLQPRILAWRGDQVAVPVDVNADPTFEDLRNSLIEGVTAAEPVAPFYTSMPTPGTALETRLGQCSGCEPFIEETREIELQQRRATANAAELELRRSKMRLDATPPNLDPPVPAPSHAIAVRLEQAKS